MGRLMLVTGLVFAASHAFAADNAICKLSDDKKVVTVIASNPYSQVMQCEVNCHMAIPNGISTVVCVKPVAVGAKDQVICTEPLGEGKAYSRLKEASVNCPDPTAAAPPPAKEDEDDDAEAEALMKKMQEQGVDMLKRMKKQ